MECELIDKLSGELIRFLLLQGYLIYIYFFTKNLFFKHKALLLLDAQQIMLLSPALLPAQFSCGAIRHQPVFGAPIKKTGPLNQLKFSLALCQDLI